MKETFILYTEYATHISLLNMEQRGVLFTAIMCYESEEELPEMDAVTQMAFSFIRANLDRNENSYQKKLETNRENGKKGGRPKREDKANGISEETQKPNGFEEKPKKANGYFENPNDNKNDNDNGNDNDTYTSIEVSVPRTREDGTDDKASATDEISKNYLAFMREHPDIREDLENPDELYGIDFALLSQKISESKRYLQGKTSLKWLLRHYPEIIGDSYKDFAQSIGESPPAYIGKGDLQLWRELMTARDKAKETRWCDSVQRGMELYRMADEEARREMDELYKALSREIVEYFEPNSFLDLCGMNDVELKYERARFLKTLPEIRKKIAGGGYGTCARGERI